MGLILSCKCSCGYETELFCGAGLGAKNPSVIEKCVPEEVFADFSEKLTEGRVSGYMLENKAAVCENCGELSSVSVFSYRLPEGADAAYVTRCAECGGDVRILEDTGNIRCPKCGSVLTAAAAGHWD
ncbi:MAG: hypothetical protein NC395_07845 [Prevotella sp.]|nr:hypothetical protein [Prevotella sp.]